MVPFGMQAVSKRSWPTNTAEHVATRAAAAAADGTLQKAQAGSKTNASGSS
jgi:hypothetical protein